MSNISKKFKTESASGFSLKLAQILSNNPYPRRASDKVFRLFQASLLNLLWEANLTRVYSLNDDSSTQRTLLFLWRMSYIFILSGTAIDIKLNLIKVEVRNIENQK